MYEDEAPQRITIKTCAFCGGIGHAEPASWHQRSSDQTVENVAEDFEKSAKQLRIMAEGRGLVHRLSISRTSKAEAYETAAARLRELLRDR